MSDHIQWVTTPSELCSYLVSDHTKSVIIPSALWPKQWVVHRIKKKECPHRWRTASVCLKRSTFLSACVTATDCSLWFYWILRLADGKDRLSENVNDNYWLSTCDIFAIVSFEISFFRSKVWIPWFYFFLVWRRQFTGRKLLIKHPVSVVSAPSYRCLILLQLTTVMIALIWVFWTKYETDGSENHDSDMDDSAMDRLAWTNIMRHSQKHWKTGS